MLEMMVVILVVALLFLLTVPNITRVINIVQDKGCDAQLSVVDAAIIQYFMIFEVYPTSLDALIEEGLLSDDQNKCQSGEIIGIQNNQAYKP